ncbi:MAG: hypothetical protein QOH97_1039 [Actinoplanes sp.]|jgi:nucleotide-binding universal stress UspA family protein|nr:hypothetical protein [Actinoplanes sp.]
MAPKKIIIGYDGSADSLTAAQWALDEAARTQAPLEFFYASEWAPYVPSAAMTPVASPWPDTGTEPAVIEMLEAALADAARTHPGVVAGRVAVQAFASFTLIKRSADAGLIVLGRSSRSAFAGMLLGSVSVAVSAHALCPVAVIRGSLPGPESPPRSVVVVGMDDCAGSRLALDHAFEQAMRRGLELRVIRAWPPARDEITASVLGDPPAHAGAQTALTDLIAGWQEKYPAVRAYAEVVAGHPAETLQEASRTAQLLVVGAHGRGALRGMTLGSVSQHLLRHADCPVLVVREAAPV